MKEEILSPEATLWLKHPEKTKEDWQREAGLSIDSEYVSSALEASRKSIAKNREKMEYKTLMGFNEYQQWQVSLLSEASRNDQLINGLLGLSGEVGEVCDLFKKHYHHGNELDLDKVRKELGDVLFYLSSTADAMGFTLQSVADGNYSKLSKRYPKGHFTVEDSKAKKDEM